MGSDVCRNPHQRARRAAERDPRKAQQIRTELEKGTGILKTARLTSAGVATVQRIKRETAAGMIRAVGIAAS
jgi:DNA invertase Pin-like site-specific DNA recombinase